MSYGAASNTNPKEVSLDEMPELFVNPGPGTSDSAVTDMEQLKSYKRPYRKSVTGCQSCKARRIKCDEQRPVCANCKRRYLNVTCCDYNAKTSRAPKGVSVSLRSSRSLPPAAPKLGKQVAFKPFELEESNRMLELRLLYHYTKMTCTAGESLRSMVPILCHPMWEVSIPQMAFSSPIVLDALLGVSALHLLALQPGDHSLVLASKSYFNKALTKQRDLVSSLNAGNAEALLVAAVLIAHHTWLATHIIEYDERPNARYNMTLQTYAMCLGIQGLMRRASPWLEKYTFGPEDASRVLDEATRNKGFMKLALEDMASLSVYFCNNNVPPGDSDTYEKVASEVVIHYSLLMAEPLDTSRIEQAVVTILHRMPVRYVELLGAEDPIAMALLARNLSLLSYLEDSTAWWIHGAGDQKVPHKAVNGIRELMPTEWLWTMTFPMNIIAKEIKLDFN